MRGPTRREFMAVTATGIAAASLANAANTEGKPVHITARDYLADILYTRQEVDDWFDGKAFPFSRHDPELGWLLPDARFADGLDGSISTYRYEMDNGPRKMINYADQPCRINTYGDSYTQCHQVSDGETWQENLAAHLCEPVRNFGIGGWSVYQAYLRMRREEARTPAPYIILNIYDDDHYRNLDSWRNIRVHKHPQHIESTLPHLVVDMKNRTCAERPNPCRTREDYYRLCNLDWVAERFKDDFVLSIMLAHANAKGGNPEAAYKEIQDLATTHGINTRIDASGHMDEAAQAIFNEAALFSSMYLVDKVEAFARERGKRVLYVLSYPAKRIAQRLNEGTRWDQPFVDFLREKALPVVDLMEAHTADYAQFSISVEEYLKRYWIGHYNPLGNHFTAFALKNNLVEMLDPKPAPYLPM
ncbi:MAG: SGNH/GDSL hydrolase family protein [Candidatus Hydrogenedentes bacterium]|nr:SGNH/GDSL hydrolase family protein [Candidatus Hydrogenedentota bacterium]